MAGKNHLLRWTRLYLDGYDISGDARSLDSLENSFGEVDITGWSENPRNYLPDGLRTVGVRGFQALLNDTASSGAHTLLASPDTGHEISVLFGGGAEPDEGDPCYLLGGVQMSDAAGWEGQAAVIKADFLPETGITNGNPWGVVLSDATSLSATTNKAAHNNGAATTNGWQANLHVTASSGGTWSFVLQASTSGAYAGEETTLGTFTANGSAVTSEHLTGTGSTPQYIRLRAVRTSGTVTPVVTFARL